MSLLQGKKQIIDQVFSTVMWLYSGVLEVSLEFLLLPWDTTLLQTLALGVLIGSFNESLNQVLLSRNSVHGMQDVSFCLPFPGF